MPNNYLHHHHATVNHHSPPKPNPQLLSTFLKFTIMFFIFSLFLIFFSLASILLLNLLIAGSFINRHRRHQHTAVSQHHLPTFIYSPSATTTDDCSICLESFKQGEACRTLPVCDHFFHAQCVDSWLKEVLNCPVCRSPVPVDVHRSSDLIASEDDDSKIMWAIGVGGCS